MADQSRNPLSTDPDDFCFFDTETRSREDVTTAGAYRHNAAGQVIILTYAIGADAPVREWVVPDFDTPLDQHYMPDDLRLFLIRARQGKAWFVAWNAAFDRLSFNRGVKKPNTPQAPYMTVEMVIDAMAQGGKSHLPPDLAGAAEAAGSPIGKQKDGKRLIKLFCDAGGEATPQTHPEDWEKFKSYARDDVGALREIFFGTMPLSRAEWEEYWASEHINDTGLPVDGEFARQAAALAERNAREVQRQVAEISRGELYSVNQTARMTDWVMERIGHLSRARRILTSEIVEGEPDADGNDVHEAKLSLQRSRVEELILYLEQLDEEHGLTDAEAEVLDMLDVRVYGASATPMKFGKIARQLEDGRLKGSYVFNGANATGRFSSRGVQTHNLTRGTLRPPEGDTREPVDIEADVIDQITAEGANAYPDLTDQFGPVGRTLSRLIRPTITAPDGKVLVWGDWSAIEARVLPWLAASPSADKVLDTFRRNDADPSRPDIYKTTASDILRVLGHGVAPEEVTGAQRQSHGKVPTLALGFGGANGALFAMGLNYGVSFADDEATEVVHAWRDSNPWARRFWDALWTGALSTLENPDTVFTAGRVQLVYIKDYMSGTLFMVLPCGRELMYPRVRWEKREIKDKQTGKVQERTQLTYRRGRGRAALWYGTLAENATQGFAGSLMRQLLTGLVYDSPMSERGLGPLLVPIGHTHDEAVTLVDEEDVEAGKQALHSAMTNLPGYADGLPIAAGVTAHYCYTKTLD